MDSLRTAIFSLLILAFSTVARGDGYMELRVSLFPAGSFVAKSSKVTGSAEVNGNTVTARDIKVDTTSFDSGIDLRNKHMRKRFNTDKHPHAILLEGKGQDGKGTAKLQVNGITKDVEGTYKIKDDKELEATFKTKASEFDIKDVSYMGVGMEDELEVFVRVPVKKGGGAPPAEARSEPAKTEKPAAKGKAKKK